ncbi:hypothetical protein ATN00_07245 [Sphingobium baderi]|jgi:hypothetical protein|uniref:Uncharacterized protein n=2 Tax=Sphingobium TaxID=165695 RepID=A0A0S3EXE5_9SPHN|nr:hypothetical protein ATN00_07245 [Sphingobium baderi]
MQETGMFHHVHITALSRTSAGMTVITLAICGPRGGMRAVEDISLEEAEKMAARLQAAITAARAGLNTDPADAFIQDVIAQLGDPALALDPSFRRWCGANHGLLTARQTAERWCRWRVA